MLWGFGALGFRGGLRVLVALRALLKFLGAHGFLKLGFREEGLRGPGVQCQKSRV